MSNDKIFDVIIIGGSYAGLSAAMTLGRSLRNVLVIDSNEPCNRQTPYSHNFITHDGKTPKEISTLAKEEVSKYDTVKFHTGHATKGTQTESGFEIQIQDGITFPARKLIFATGLKDIPPDIRGFAECWGISVIHCPYCHGYEVRNEPTGILANGGIGYELAKLINHWAKDLYLLTNGKSTLTEEQTAKIEEHDIKIVESEIDGFEHIDGYVDEVIFKDKSRISLKAVYAKPDRVQQSDIPLQLGCELTEQGLIAVDLFQKTTVAGVFACGDATNFGRAVAASVSSGSLAGMSLNKELIDENF